MRVLTIGTFDILHPGHLELLAECRRLAAGGPVFVGVNRDEFVQRYKGRLPSQPLAHRMEILGALRDVDAVAINTGDEDSAPLIEACEPDIIAIGDDWLDPDDDERRYLRQLGITRDFLTDRGIRIEYVPRTRGLSSTALRAVS